MFCSADELAAAQSASAGLFSFGIVPGQVGSPFGIDTTVLPDATARHGRLLILAESSRRLFEALGPLLSEFRDLGRHYELTIGLLGIVLEVTLVVALGVVES